ncbi:hypothetical protein CFRA_08870 [Corynebacterium frankenforstense DSM 45800]|uniref:Uncharacterized protein n=1 Tax=Corynebacterium frankenforstense DSM 45800 TaxID=1437875 RepID=A0A1L7CU05_9CORY|nr:hypothetical protein [Corynebacterium frankenforstense]APT89343.1 hypothetical protein CFRA_08870 [Corynebacterium frankenforstense DSM 45800]
MATLAWPGFDGPVSGSVPELAELWLSRCTDRPLSSLSPALDPAHLPEAVAPGSPVALRWLSGFPVPLDASVVEVSTFRGVGKVKLRAIVECLVQEAVDAGGAA